MSFNIFEEAKLKLAPDLVAMTSSFLGESIKSVNKAMSAILPLVVKGIVSRAEGGNSGAKEVYSTSQKIHENNYSAKLSTIFNDRGIMLNKGAAILQCLFGDKLGGIIEAISSYAGIERSSASTLCSLTALVIAGITGKQLAENNLDVDELVHLLQSQQEEIFPILSPEMERLATALNIARPVTDTDRFKNTTQKNAKDSFWTSIAVVLLVIAAVIAIWLFWG